MKPSEPKPLAEYVGARSVALSGALGFLLPAAGLLAMFAGLASRNVVTALFGGLCIGIFIAPHLAIWGRATAKDFDTAERALISNLHPTLTRWFAYTIITLSLVLSAIAA